MKKIIFSMCFLSIALTTFSTNYIILNSTRAGGVFGLYGTVKQEMLGTLSGTNTVAYNLDCSGIGFNRCRVAVHGISSGGGMINPDQIALFNFCYPFVGDIEEDMETEVDLGNLSGSLSRQVYWDKDGDGSYDSLVSFQASWNSEDAYFNDGNSTISIIEIDYPF